MTITQTNQHPSPHSCSVIFHKTTKRYRCHHELLWQYYMLSGDCGAFSDGKQSVSSAALFVTFIKASKWVKLVEKRLVSKCLQWSHLNRFMKSGVIQVQRWKRARFLFYFLGTWCSGKVKTFKCDTSKLLENNHFWSFFCFYEYICH